MLINAINGEEVDCVLSALSSPLQEELISKNRNVMNARVWLGLGKDGIPVVAKGIGGGRIGQFFMKQIFKIKMNFVAVSTCHFDIIDIIHRRDNQHWHNYCL